MTQWTRELAFGMEGDDVKRIKDALVTLGLLHASTHRVFGPDTRQAVEAFQQKTYGTGRVDARTWADVIAAAEARTAPSSGKDGVSLLPDNLGPEAAAAIGPALAAPSALRRELVINALTFAYDPALPRDFPLSLYIRGGNLYNTDLSPNVITLARIASGARRQPQYYDGGRREMMERAVKCNPSITGADCSGGIVGLLRHAGAVKPGFDLSADGFAHSSRYRRIDAAQLQPGDLLHKSGHIGLYVGGGYGVEWMGGAYGCQLTRLADRQGYSFVTGKTGRMSPWTGFLRPSYY